MTEKRSPQVIPSQWRYRPGRQRGGFAMSPWLNLVCLLNLGCFALYRERDSGAVYIRYGRSGKLRKILGSNLFRKV